jgi:Fe-S oxidoreductase
VCPAWGVGKSLNPKEVVQNIRTSAAGIAESVTEEALWACTTCNACVEACPVLIRHVDLIVDARRALVAEGRLAGSGAGMLRQVQSTGSSWGQLAVEREKWMEGSAVPLARDLIAEGRDFDVLLWIGCAGAQDPSAIRTMRQFASLLNTAGVSFAALGKEEKCTGDPARRTGDEFLFQELAANNIATFAQYGVKRIVTACPHCFNTLKNEYPQFGGEYDVLHHTQMLAELVAQGRLKAPSFADGEVTLHDPCYLGRVNNEADAPRVALGVRSNRNQSPSPLRDWLDEPMEPGNKIAEATHVGRKTLCCGAGGGRMWMEEDPSQRPGVRRILELASTGANTVVVACPFCRIMLDASLAQSGIERQISLKDVCEILYEANS